ncbi:hypothetical protein GF377_09720 [candidate division GN15 bacterium]|nr:hypothetical protein [candidate division GN15 bacterium]
MHKRILIAEQADTLRSVAETVLRQNGYEVISVSDAERAQEVLSFSRPDLMVIGADLQTPTRTPLYEEVQSDAKTSAIPLLVFEPADKSEVSFPEEVVIPRPFDPKEFLSKVEVFVGQSQDDRKAKPANPLDAVDDDFLDAALGLDKLDVTDSEVMDKTGTVPTKDVKSGSDKVVDLGTEDGGEEAEEDVSKVESLMVTEDASQIRHSDNQQKSPPPPPSASGKLDILDDQFNIEQAEVPDDSDVHDYDWFVKSMSAEHGAHQSGQAAPATVPNATATKPAAPAQPADKSHQQQPAPAPKPTTGPTAKKKADADGGAGVEKFIDEFKKELEHLRSSDAVEDLFISAEPPADADQTGGMTWQETVENITPKNIRLFTEQFADRLGKRVAEMLVSKIDPEKLTRLIQREILEEIKSRR